MQKFEQEWFLIWCQAKEPWQPIAVRKYSTWICRFHLWHEYGWSVLSVIRYGGDNIKPIKCNYFIHEYLQYYMVLMSSLFLKIYNLIYHYQSIAASRLPRRACFFFIRTSNQTRRNSLNMTFKQIDIDLNCSAQLFFFIFSCGETLYPPLCLFVWCLSDFCPPFCVSLV